MAKIQDELKKGTYFCDAGHEQENLYTLEYKGYKDCKAEADKVQGVKDKLQCAQCEKEIIPSEGFFYCEICKPEDRKHYC